MKDNKLFWTKHKTVKPFFSNKGDLGPNIKLVEKIELIQNNQEIANEINTFFKYTLSDKCNLKDKWKSTYHKSSFRW